MALSELEVLTTLGSSNLLWDWSVGLLGSNYFKGVREKYFTVGLKEVSPDCRYFVINRSKVFATKVASTHGIVKRAADLAEEVNIYSKFVEAERKWV